MIPKHQPPSGLNNCPADVLHLVLKLLSPAELRVLCLVNKNIRTFTEPFLYSKVQWIWREPNSPPPITQLVRTILCRPQLAAYIRNLHLEGSVFRQPPFMRSGPKIPVPSAEIDKLIVFIQKIGVRYSDLCIEELAQGITDALVALLLAQLPNLRYLYLDSAFVQQSAIIGMVLRSAIYEPADHGLPDFRLLQDVSFLTRTGEDTARDKIQNTEDVLPFFYLPNVKRMSVAIENPVSFTQSIRPLPIPSRLKSLNLTAIRESYLGEVLSVTKNVENLRWEFFYDFGIDDDINTPIVDLDSLGSAISRIRDTSQDLSIFAMVERAGGDPFLPAIKIEGSLHAIVNLDKLKRLQVPLAFLVGFAQDTTKRLQDMIPRNAEFVSLTYDLWDQNEDGKSREWPEWEWEDQAVLNLLQNWLKDCKACTPNIRGISLILEQVDTDIDEWCPSMRHQLRELGAQVGVQLEIYVKDEM